MLIFYKLFETGLAEFIPTQSVHSPNYHTMSNNNYRAIPADSKKMKRDDEYFRPDPILAKREMARQPIPKIDPKDTIKRLIPYPTTTPTRSLLTNVNV